MKRTVINSLFVATGAVMAMCATAAINQKSTVAYAASTAASISYNNKTYTSLSDAATAAKGSTITIGSGIVTIDKTINTTTINLDITGDCTFISTSGIGTMFTVSSFTSKVSSGSLTVGTETVTNCAFLKASSSITMSGKTYIQNLSSSSDGVITGSTNSDQITASFNGINFINCSGVNGGAISISAKKTISITNCTFKGCSATNGGAVYYNGKSGNNSLQLSNTSFEGCSAENGGAIYTAGSNTSVSLSNCNFDGNTATNDGGALFVVGKSATVDGCTLNKNTAENGGAVYSTLDGLMSLNGSNVTNNNATFGGGVYVENGNVSIDSHTDISGNNATAGGSGILVNSETTTVTGAENIGENKINGQPDNSGVENATGIDYDAAIEGLETQVSLSFGHTNDDGNFTYFVTSNGVKKEGYIGIHYRTYLPMEIWKTIRSGIKSIGVEYGNATVSKETEILAKDIKTYNKNVTEEGADCVSTAVRILVTTEKFGNEYYGRGYVKDNKGEKHYLGETKREFSVIGLAQEYLGRKESLELSDSTIAALENIVK